MKLYHMSDTLKLGDVLTPDFKKTMPLPSPLFRRWKKARTATMPWYSTPNICVLF